MRPGAGAVQDPGAGAAYGRHGWHIVYASTAWTLDGIRDRNFNIQYGVQHSGEREARGELVRGGAGGGNQMIEPQSAPVRLGFRLPEYTLRRVRGRWGLSAQPLRPTEWV